MAPLTEDAEKALRWADAHVDVFDIFLDASGFSLGGVNLETPKGIWMSGRIKNEQIESGVMRFDGPNENAGLTDTIVDTVIDATFDVILSGSNGPVDVSTSGFVIQHGGQYIEALSGEEVLDQKSKLTISC